jgi:hypothetical protein
MIKGQNLIAKLSIIAGVISLICLLLLHFLSPEFEPNWRMISEYAYGNYKWLLSIFFIAGGLSSMLLSVCLLQFLTNKISILGDILLFISGMGGFLASIFDVTQTTGHGIAASLGVPTFPIAALILSYHLSKKEYWKDYRKPIITLSHLSWIGIVLLVISMITMMNGFKEAGITIGPDRPVPTSLPDGVVAVVGYVNRLLIVVNLLWAIIVATRVLRLSRLPEQNHTTRQLMEI